MIVTRTDGYRRNGLSEYMNIKKREKRKTPLGRPSLLLFMTLWDTMIEESGSKGGNHGDSGICDG